MNESLYRKAERICHPVRRRERRVRAGEIVSGSASDQVLQLLQSVHPKYLTRCQIVKQIDMTPKSIDWAINYLQQIGMIKAVPAFDKRSPLYNQYCYRDGKQKAK